MKLATLCYLQNNGKTLMLHRNKRSDDMHYGNYVAVGGKIISGESPEECIIREFKEETGLNLLDPQLKGILTFSNKGRVFGNQKPQEDWYVFVYTTGKFKGDLKETKEGTLEWVANESLKDLKMWEGDKLFLPWVYQPKFFSGKLVYENKKLVDHTVVFY